MVGDDPMEVEAVEPAPARLKVGDGQRRLVGGQLDADRAAVGIEMGNQGHGRSVRNRARTVTRPAWDAA